MTLYEIRGTVNRNKSSLIRIFNKVEKVAEKLAITKFLANPRQKVAGEVEYTYQWFSSLVKDLDKALMKLLEATEATARVGGIFCHKRAFFCIEPTCKKGNCAEIGDVLILIRLYGSDKEWHSAQLLQFKFGKANISSTDAKNPQYLLYNRQPKFRWKSPSIGIRDLQISGTSPQNAAKYGLIFADGGSLKFVAQAAKIDGDQVSLSEEVFNHLIGRSGREFDPKSSLNGDWDQVVDELIKGTLSKLVTLTTQGQKGSPVSAGQCHALSHLTSHTRPPNSPRAPLVPPDSSISEEDLPGGITIIEISIDGRNDSENFYR